MFQKKRQLKKEKSKTRAKNASTLITIALALILIFEIGFFYFFFGRANFISPLSKVTSSKVLQVSTELEKKNISFSSIQLSSDGSYLVTLKDGAIVTLSSKKDIKKQVSSLQLMLSRLTIEGKKLKSLDFRFNNPVVSF